MREIGAPPFHPFNLSPAGCLPLMPNRLEEAPPHLHPVQPLKVMGLGHSFIGLGAAQTYIPPRAGRKNPPACDYHAYKDRNRIERMFNRIKQFRRIPPAATRPKSHSQRPSNRGGEDMAAPLCQHDLRRTYSSAFRQ